MTSRTTPVGIFVIALLGVIVIGCSAPTGAVFQALIDPAGTVLSTPEAEPAGTAAGSSETEVWWQHPDGYEMVLPAGWSGLAPDDTATAELKAALQAMPELAARVDAVLEGSQIRVSAIAVQRDATGLVTPLLLVLAEPTDGRRPHRIKTDTYDRISGLPNLDNTLSSHSVTLPAAKGERYDYTIIDPDLGELRVRSFLFRRGRTVFLVNFIASPALVGDAGAIFDQITESLRFGV